MAAVQFVFTVGTVVLGLYVASKVLGIEPGEGRGRGSKGQKWGSGRCVRLLPCALVLTCCRGVPIALCCAVFRGCQHDFKSFACILGHAQEREVILVSCRDVASPHRVQSCAALQMEVGIRR